jgi:NADH:ubiquinone oxidoreductase subunit 4 (subunit M)
VAADAALRGVLLGIMLASGRACPGLNGFVGEFLIMLGTFRTYPVLAA